MFHSLLNYEKEDYYKEHSTIYFDTIKGNGTYEVIGAFRTDVDESNSNLFKYYEFYDADSEEDFDNYVSKVKSLTPYTIEATPEYGSKLLTLSTCAYHSEEGRYVVVAVKMQQ